MADPTPPPAGSGGPEDVPWWASAGSGQAPTWWQEPGQAPPGPGQGPPHRPFSPSPNPGYRQATGRPTEGLAKGAVASIVWGVLGLACCGPIGGGIAIYQGSQARYRIQVSNGRLGGNGAALFGMLLGGIAIIVWLFSLYWYATGHRVLYVTPTTG
jgi:hypothetical protein